MSVDYDAIYGVGVSLNDELYPEELVEKFNVSYSSIDYPNDPDETIEILNNLLGDYQCLEAVASGNHYADWYKFYILIKNPFEDLETLSFKIKELKRFINEKGFEKYCEDVEPGLVGGPVIC